MSPDELKISEELGKEKNITASEQFQIQAMLEALNYIVAQVTELQKKMTEAGNEGKSINDKQQKKSKVLLGESKDLMSAITVIREGNLKKFAKINVAMGKEIQKKRELNEEEIEELIKIRAAMNESRGTMINLVEFTSNFLVNTKKLAELLNSDETEIVIEQSALERL